MVISKCLEGPNKHIYYRFSKYWRGHGPYQPLPSSAPARPTDRLFVLKLQSVSIHSSYKQAIVYECWNAVMKQELKASDENQNGIWFLVLLMFLQLALNCCT